MLTQIEIQLEIEPVAPDTEASFTRYLNAALGEAVNESALTSVTAKDPEVVFEQRLPLETGVEIFAVVLKFVLEEGPIAWAYVQAFWAALILRLGKRPAPTTVGFKLTIGEKTIEVKNLSPKDTIKIMTEKYEAELRPRKR